MILANQLVLNLRIRTAFLFFYVLETFVSSILVNMINNKLNDWYTSDKVTEITTLLGNIGYGKTYAAGFIQEKYSKEDWPVCVIDRMGIHYVIRHDFDEFVIIGGDYGDIKLEEVDEYIGKVLDGGYRFIVDLSGRSDSYVEAFAEDFFDLVFEWHRVNKKPRNYMLEECDFYIPQTGGNKRCKEMITKCITKGRMYGFGFTLLSQRYRMVDKTPLEQSRNYIAFNMKGKNDLALLRMLIGEDVSSRVRMLKEGECLIMSDEGYGKYTVGTKVSPPGASTPKVGEVLEEVGVLPLNKEIAVALGLEVK